jgi:hypothetical protein
MKKILVESSENSLFEQVFGWMLVNKNNAFSKPIINAYRLSIIFLMLPNFCNSKKNSVWIIGSKIYSSDESLKKYTLIKTPKDLKKRGISYEYFAQFFNIYPLIYLSFVMGSDVLLKHSFRKIEKVLKKAVLQ